VYRNTQCKIIVLFAAAALSHGACAGEIYRCTAANGDVMFTNLACPSTSKAQQIASYVAEPDVAPELPDRAAESAAASAREAREAAAQAQAAASRSAEAAYLQAEAAATRAEAVSERRADTYYDYPAWAASYPFQPHRHRQEGHDRHHDGRKAVTQLPYPSTLPINSSLFMGHR